MSNFGKPKKVSKMHHFSLFDHNGLNDFLCIAKFVMLIFYKFVAEILGAFFVDIYIWKIQQILRILRQQFMNVNVAT
jgi:hypothetical protein